MYSSASSVAQFTPNLVSGSTTFSPASLPTLDAVEAWLSTGCSLIHTALNGAGYSTPVSVSTAPAVYGQVQNLEMIYGAAMAEMTRLTTRTAANERTRGQIFMKMFNDGLEARALDRRLRLGYDSILLWVSIQVDQRRILLSTILPSPNS